MSPLFPKCVRMEGGDDPRFIELACHRTAWLLGRGGLHGWDLSMMLANAYAQGVYDIVNRVPITKEGATTK